MRAFDTARAAGLRSAIARVTSASPDASNHRDGRSTDMILASLMAAALAAPAPAAKADDYVGRWNVKITDATGTCLAGGFQIDKKDGGLAGALVWRAGSFAPVKSVEVKDGVLRMVREEKPGRADVFEAKVEKGVLAGQVTYPDGKVNHFEGRQAPSLATKGKPAWGAPITLFDGKTLDGWRLRDPSAKRGWAVVNGELA